MRRVLLPGVAAVLLLYGPGQAAQGPDRTGPIAVSGGAEIREVRIAREKVAYAAKDADLTNMTVGLWFPAKWKGRGDGYLLRLTALSPVADDTGKVLSTKGRLADVPALRGEVRAEEIMAFGGRAGPVLRVLLDVPARPAKTLQALQGKAEVSRVRMEEVKFGLAAAEGKPLAHPLLKGLKVTPSSSAGPLGITVTLRVPAMHARLVRWAVEAGGRQLRTTSLGERREGGEVDLEQTFPGKLPKGCSLVLEVAVPVETKTFEFDFKDVELP
jgi:hypothetical protein